MKKPKTKSLPAALPTGITAKDLTYPKWKLNDTANRVVDQFELWYTERFGWCIPTLLIRRAGRFSSQSSDRTYATTMDGDPIRMGLGPHVKAQVTVYVRESRKADLQRFLDLKTNGEATAGDIRDRISTRRAQTEMRRSIYRGIFS